MRVPTTDQMRAWDAYTIEHEPIASIALMERAASVFVEWFVGQYPDLGRPIHILAGTGNNGGDGVAAARMLHQRGYEVELTVCDFLGRHSADFSEQVRRLPNHGALTTRWINSSADLPAINTTAVIIDALFGTGLARPLEGCWAAIVERINCLPNEVVAIDLPSGLFADKPTTGPCVHADKTFCFETPRKAFFFPENGDRVGEWAFGSIGLHPDFWNGQETADYYLTAKDVASLVKPRARFSHKGTYGHALLICGRRGSMGAALLAARACLRSGVGLLTVHVPASGYEILQLGAPEALCDVGIDSDHWTALPELGPYSAIGIGCGIGQAASTAQALKRLLQKASVPLVLDADAINILARRKEWLRYLPPASILTPHPKEFERLFGPTPNSFERNALQRAKAQELGVYLILKGAYTCVCTPDGTCWFNSTGNPGMATGGSGDVLTGILTGLLAQGYTPFEASLLGVYLHGLAGDIAAAYRSQPGLIAGDIVDFLPEAWKTIAASR
ncbi:MAG: NAD(P)H-hydrate dehydratase [Saprospiraceae bacterium]|nr:NAD(P)H-hydrate dehydratase [Saprospiraceae bacterium]MDW8484629.1 NAD(P)H-hydrate dehydratase [Saprospiraceae bacterium]